MLSLRTAWTLGERVLCADERHGSEAVLRELTVPASC